MREIKFRAWDKANKIMVYSNENKSAEWWDGCKMSSVDMVNGRLAETEYEWMQFTGLYDVNGTEIYEGDLVKMCSGRCKAEIGFKDGCFVAFHSGTYEMIYEFYDDVEVIGNIHD